MSHAGLRPSGGATDSSRGRDCVKPLYYATSVAARAEALRCIVVKKKIVPQATYDKIKDQIIAKQGAKK